MFSWLGSKWTLSHPFIIKKWPVSFPDMGKNHKSAGREEVGEKQRMGGKIDRGVKGEIKHCEAEK